MRYDEFIERVQQVARLDSRQRAEEVTSASLETLGERIDRKVKDGVAAQLPKELKELLHKRAGPDRYVLQEFYNRVGARAGTGYQDAARLAKAVLSVLGEAIPQGEVQDILESLPAEYGDLFAGPGGGPGFPSLDRTPPP